MVLLLVMVMVLVLNVFGVGDGVVVGDGDGVGDGVIVVLLIVVMVTMVMVVDGAIAGDDCAASCRLSRGPTVQKHVHGVCAVRRAVRSHRGAQPVARGSGSVWVGYGSA